MDNPKLKVILMSATIDTNIFTAYFDCPLLKIPGRMYPVEINQLEDVLGMLRYADKQIQNETLKTVAVTEAKGSKKTLPKRSTYRSVFSLHSFWLQSGYSHSDPDDNPILTYTFLCLGFRRSAHRG